MNKQVKIERLRIRVPAAPAGNPQALAGEVARRLAGVAGGWRESSVDSIRATVPVAGGSGAGLAGSIARSVNESVNGAANHSASQRGKKS